MKAGSLGKAISYPAGVLKYISNYTAVLNVQGKLQESIRFNLEAVEIGNRYGLKLPTAKAYGNLGAVYQYQENYPEAVKYYLKALPLIEQYADLQTQAILLNNLCCFYRDKVGVNGRVPQPQYRVDVRVKAIKTQTVQITYLPEQYSTSVINHCDD